MDIDYTSAREKTVCPHCAGPHTHVQCKTKNNKRLLRCANCHQKHGAYSKQCPFYLKYKAVIDKQNYEIETRWQERKAKENQEIPANKVPNSNRQGNSTKQNDRDIQDPIHTKDSPLPQEVLQTRDQSSDPNNYISKEQLKNILLELFENQQITTADRAGKLTIIEKTIETCTVCPPFTNRRIQAKSPNLSLSPVRTPSGRKVSYIPIANYWKTSTPNIGESRINMTPKRLSMVETRKINKKNNKEQPISKYVNAPKH